jgi:Arm DNA-binding domain
MRLSGCRSDAASRPDGSCVKSWQFYYRTRQGLQRRPTIGRFPQMSLSEAREMAKALDRRVSLGEDPSAEWQEAREAPTVADLAKKYLDGHAKKKNSERWAHEAELW